MLVVVPKSMLFPREIANLRRNIIIAFNSQKTVFTSEHIRLPPKSLRFPPKTVPFQKKNSRISTKNHTFFEKCQIFSSKNLLTMPYISNK